MLDFLQKTNKQDSSFDGKKNESFWSILIEPEWISSSVWQIEDKKVKIISTAPPTRWEGDLLEPIDSSLSACVQNLPDEMPDPVKTVFGLPNSWIEGGDIKEQHLITLKKICDALSLVPSGFVVLSEAISYFYKKEEGAGLNGITVGISDQNLEVSIFNLGVLVGATNVSRSVSIEDDLTEGLARLSDNLDNFPSRVIIFNQKESELEWILEILNNSDWNKIGNSKFIHTPRVEIFNPQNKIVAVSLAGGSEMGATNGVLISGFKEDDLETISREEIVNLEKSDDLTAKDLGFVAIPEKLSKLREIGLKKFMSSVPKVNFSFLASSRSFIIGGSTFLTFLIVGFLYWWFAPRAVVTIYVSPKQLEENILFNLSDLKNEEISVVLEGEKIQPTTGTKIVGEKAKGQVKIQNGTAFPINLPKGSILISASDLRFVTVSSASVSGALSPLDPGTAIIDVEAGSIGSEYNLGKDEIFKVANYPKAEVDAISIDNFSGGSSRQISSVSEDDRKLLLKNLTDELVSDAKGKLLKQVSDNDYLIDSLLKITVKKEDYSNKVGDEATSVKLSLGVEVKAISVSRNDLANLVRKFLNNKIPEGFVLRDDQLKYQFEQSEKDLKVRVTANLLPIIDSDEIAKKIAGKYPNLAEDYLSGVSGFVKAEIRLKPKFPEKIKTLPRIPKNINIIVSADK